MATDNTYLVRLVKAIKVVIGWLKKIPQLLHVRNVLVTWNVCLTFESLWSKTYQTNYGTHTTQQFIILTWRSIGIISRTFQGKSFSSLSAKSTMILLFFSYVYQSVGSLLLLLLVDYFENSLFCFSYSKWYFSL